MEVRSRLHLMGRLAIEWRLCTGDFAEWLRVISYFPYSQ